MMDKDTGILVKQFEKSLAEQINEFCVKNNVVVSEIYLGLLDSEELEYEVEIELC